MCCWANVFSQIAGGKGLCLLAYSKCIRNKYIVISNICSFFGLSLHAFYANICYCLLSLSWHKVTSWKCFQTYTQSKTLVPHPQALKQMFPVFSKWCSSMFSSLLPTPSQSYSLPVCMCVFIDKRSPVVNFFSPLSFPLAALVICSLSSYSQT